MCHTENYFFFQRGGQNFFKRGVAKNIFVYTFLLDILISVRYTLFVYTFRLDIHASVRYTHFVYTFRLGIHISYTCFG